MTILSTYVRVRVLYDYLVPLLLKSFLISEFYVGDKCIDHLHFMFLDINVGNINIVKKSTDAVLVTNIEIVIEVNAENANGSFAFTSRHLCCNTVA